MIDIGENMDPQAGDRQTKKPKTASRKRRVVMATLALLVVALGAWAIYHYTTRKPEITLDLGNNVKMRLVLIPAGTFMMGSPANETNRDSNEGPQHEVTITKPFYMGIYEVTQEQYEAVMGTNPSNFKFEGETKPVEMVTWHDAVEFCGKLSAKTGKRAMLPSEAQWEYACRAGTTTPFNTGQTIAPNQANFESSATPGAWEKFTDRVAGLFSKREKVWPTSVGSFKPNAFGLYDMHGNVREWCADWYDDKYYSTAPKTDPLGPVCGESRVRRGGCWAKTSPFSRSACRSKFAPAHRSNDIGFRVVVAAD